MTPEQISLVQTSFAKVLPIADQAAALFYDRLFEVAPEVKPLFRGDMKVQGAKLMAAIRMVVAGLDRLDTIVPVAQDLAKRHVAYGVESAHYQIVGTALLWTLSNGLGDAFTPETEAAWTAAYGALSEVMIAAAYLDA
ncbi:MAG TPA: globin family protein [Stellaceae bacterium]|jgi:nitric oxide dioxygenase|nr:globin family protein [Stellaceae bacterium]